MEYWEIYRAVSGMLTEYFNLCGTDAFIHECVCRVQQDADDEWTSDDVRIAIRNQLNEMIEKISEPVCTFDEKYTH